ncbi:MAG TPA: phosphatase PAP2 family protein [Gemmatimonadales bacterium]
MGIGGTTTWRVLPADRLIAGYNALLAVIWAANWNSARHAAGIAGAHAAAAALPWLLRRAPRRPWGLMAAVREIYPLLFLVVFWPELDMVREVLGFYGFDQPIARLDRAVFGVHLHQIWMPRMDAPWFSELMFFSYYAYYALIFLPPLLMAILGRQATLRDMAFRLMVTYVSCYLVYLTFPVYGPHYLWEPHAGPHTDGFFFQLVAAAQLAGDSRGCAFPSSHVAGAVTIAFLGWRWFSRPVAVVLTLEALGVVLSTVYTQNHYGIDSLAGLVWALALQSVVVPAMLNGWRTPDLQPTLAMSPALGGPEEA